MTLWMFPSLFAPRKGFGEGWEGERCERPRWSQGRRAGCTQRARGGGLGRGAARVCSWGAAQRPSCCSAPVEAGRPQPEAIRSVGWSVRVALPFRKLEEGQQILLRVLVYVNNLLTLSVAANRVFVFCYFYFLHGFQCVYFCVEMQHKTCVKLTDTYWKKLQSVIIFFKC